MYIVHGGGGWIGKCFFWCQPLEFLYWRFNSNTNSMAVKLWKNLSITVKLSLIKIINNDKIVSFKTPCTTIKKMRTPIWPFFFLKLLYFNCKTGPNSKVSDEDPLTKTIWTDVWTDRVICRGASFLNSPKYIWIEDNNTFVFVFV